ncbi:hypothetical protein BC938DRAFT_481955 [Jimgerdemannia flammicorona]|uniref:Uncharacterized protein n=1 Tax=Jimgerdemannia flammicorona TaxID=994334 RepID=A0A433R0D5_9FUNG|nr:hypothetical protein BC938DRAFT_481955 [Jimgerdemannia flammicorona]
MAPDAIGMTADPNHFVQGLGAPRAPNVVLVALSLKVMIWACEWGDRLRSTSFCDDGWIVSSGFTEGVLASREEFLHPRLFQRGSADSRITCVADTLLLSPLHSRINFCNSLLFSRLHNLGCLYGRYVAYSFFFQATRPPGQATRPPIQATRPPIQAIRPPIQAIRPPIQATRPPIQATRPPIQATRLPIHPTHSVSHLALIPLLRDAGPPPFHLDRLPSAMSQAASGSCAIENLGDRMEEVRGEDL